MGKYVDDKRICLPDLYGAMYQWWMGGEIGDGESDDGISLLLSKSTKGTARFNVSIRQRNRYMPSQQMNSRRFLVFNLDIFWIRN